MASCPRLHPTTALQAGHSSLPQRSYAGGPFYFAATALRRRNYSTLRQRKLESDAERYCGRDRCHSGGFYLGLCRLRGILSPPALHDFAAGGPFYLLARWSCRRNRSTLRQRPYAGGTAILCDEENWNRTRHRSGNDLPQAELFYCAAKKNRIGRGNVAATAFRRRAILLAGTIALQ